tara:strand:- start:11899 stop:13794 length:1896 start_codon:yes stop_codon:yes gene_type:complete
MHSKLFSEYHRERFTTGGDPEEKNEANENFSGDWYKHPASDWKGAFPKMFYTNEEEYPNLNLDKAGFMAIAMSQYMGYDGPIHMTSGERLGYDQWRVMKKYQYPQDMRLYSSGLQGAVADSAKWFGFNTPEGDNHVINWIENQYTAFENGEITEKELKRRVSSHMVGDAADFIGPYRRWLRSPKSKNFRTLFNVRPLDEGDHFHVPFYDIDPETLPNDELKAHYWNYSRMFDNLAKPNSRGQLRISMNPNHYNMEQLTNLVKLDPIQVTEIPNSNLSEIAQPIKMDPIELPEMEDPNLLQRIGMSLGLREQGGPNKGWAKRVMEMGSTPESSMITDSAKIQQLMANVDMLKPQKDPTADPNFVGPVMPQWVQDLGKEDKEVTKFNVNKSGWADIDYYRENKEDNKFILGTQDLLNNKGFNVTSDGKWGNQTYKTINKYLVNEQLDNYTFSNFSQDQFLDQIWKESNGDNSRISPKGARGITQFMPKTFEWMKTKGWIPETARITDPAALQLAQYRYMDYIYDNRTNVKSAPNKTERQARAFAAYNMGPGAFDKFWDALSAEEKKAGWKTWYKKANKESSLYVLWMMDKDEYKRLYDKPEKRGSITTSKWLDVAYGYSSWKKTNPIYRYKTK